MVLSTLLWNKWQMSMLATLQCSYSERFLPLSGCGIVEISHILFDLKLWQDVGHYATLIKHLRAKDSSRMHQQYLRQMIWFFLLSDLWYSHTHILIPRPVSYHPCDCLPQHFSIIMLAEVNGFHNVPKGMVVWEPRFFCVWPLRVGSSIWEEFTTQSYFYLWKEFELKDLALSDHF